MSEKPKRIINGVSTEAATDPGEFPRAINVDPSSTAANGLRAAVSGKNSTWIERRRLFKKEKSLINNLTHLKRIHGDELGTPDFKAIGNRLNVGSRISQARANGKVRRIAAKHGLPKTFREPEVPARTVAPEQPQPDWAAGISTGIDRLRKLQEIDPSQSPYLGIRWPELAEARKGKRDKPEKQDDSKLTEDLAKLRLYISGAVATGLKKYKEEKGIPKDNSLSIDEIDAIKDKQRAFYVNLFLDSQEYMQGRDKDRIRDMFGLKRPDRDNRHGDRNDSDKRGSKPENNPKHKGDEKDKWARDVEQAKREGLLKDDDVQILLDSISDTDKRLAAELKEDFKQQGRGDELTPVYETDKDGNKVQDADGNDIIIKHNLPDNDWFDIRDTSRDTVARAHLEHLKSSGVISDYDNSSVKTLIDALDSAHKLKTKKPKK